MGGVFDLSKKGSGVNLVSGVYKKPLGGDIPFRPQENIHTCITDSGRSSLRLLLQSGLMEKRFLLPDYLCEVIPRILDQFGVQYAFYKIKQDLSIDSESIDGKEFDVLYVINYFGLRQEYRHLLSQNTWVVEDSVFSPIVEQPPELTNWAGFNSFRKISNLADGSLVKSTAKLSKGLVSRETADFSALNYKAKKIKFEYIQDKKHSEGEYLALFEQAEMAADLQTQIYSMSDCSLYNLLEFYRKLADEYAVRRRNYRLARNHLQKFGLWLRTDCPSFYVLSVDRRDELRDYLRSEGIFLPVHWPKGSGVHNELYDRIISVPVDSRYSGRDMRRIATSINRFYGAR